MSNNHRIRSWALATGTVITLLAAGGAVQARELVWSVGVGGPGVQVDVTNAQQVYLQPQPVYWQRPAVIVQPQPIYYAAPPPVYYPQPRPVYYGQPQVIVAPQPYYRGWGPHHRGHWGRHGGFDDGRRYYDGRGHGRD